MSRFLLLSLSYTEPLKVQGPQPDMCVQMAAFSLCHLYIYICRYTCFGWFACFLTASDFHTKCMQLLVGLIFCKLVEISNECFTVLLRDCVWCTVFWSGPLSPEDSSRQASSPEARAQQQAGVPTLGTVGMPSFTILLSRKTQIHELERLQTLLLS